MIEKKRVKVVVLGDIGRSPRMQNHCISLAKSGFIVDLVGYGDTKPDPSIRDNINIFYHFLMPCPQIQIKFVNYIFKTIWQFMMLLFTLSITRTSNYVLVQNPPAVPTLLVCWLYARIIGATFVIDWHNYAYTIMSMNTGKESVFVRLTRNIEKYIGRKADANFCVSNAMKEDLQNLWSIKAITLYDKPPETMKSIALEEKHLFLKKLVEKYRILRDPMDENKTVFTAVQNNQVVLKSDRPGLLVSSTSWTEDEDFSILFNALQEYENHINNNNACKLPKLICVITGKGGLKEYYINKINSRNWSHIDVITPWLEPEDYPRLLASADLGVCLHTSSSGLDLPMKVVDMFGCGLPVCAYNFKCLNELVVDGKNGFVFTTERQLAELLKNWFGAFPANFNLEMPKFQNELRAFQKLRWHEYWSTTAQPIFKYNNNL